jgi:hypothetical protein
MPTARPLWRRRPADRTTKRYSKTRMRVKTTVSMTSRRAAISRTRAVKPLLCCPADGSVAAGVAGELATGCPDMLG